MYKVKETADIAGVSVRTLHHYDQIGLLCPSSSTQSGYRLYNEHDLERLQQILFLRELGLPLEDIGTILDHPHFDRKAALHKHRDFLLAKRHRIDGLLTAVDQATTALEGGLAVSKKDMFEPFSTTALADHRKQYARETEERWGETDAYQESQRRTAKYGKEQWQAISDQSAAVYKSLAALQDRPVSDAEVQKHIERWHQLINDYFYPCSLDVFRSLGQMYTADERFTKNIDAYGQGLAAFMTKAMNYYCSEHE